MSIPLTTRYAALRGPEIVTTGQDEFDVRKFAREGGYALHEQQVDPDGVVIVDYMLSDYAEDYYGDEDGDADDDEPPTPGGESASPFQGMTRP